MQRKNQDAEYEISIETKNFLQQCKVMGHARSHIEEIPGSGVDIQLQTDKLLLQKGSSWTCPSSLGPLSLKGISPSSDSTHLTASVSIDHPHFPFFPDDPIVRTLNVESKMPIALNVKHVAGLEPDGDLAKGKPIDANISVIHQHIFGIPDGPTVRDVRVTNNNFNNPTKPIFGLEVVGDLFKRIPLPYTTLKGSFERLPAKDNQRLDTDVARSRSQFMPSFFPSYGLFSRLKMPLDNETLELKQSSKPK